MNRETEINSSAGAIFRGINARPPLLETAKPNVGYAKV